MSRMTKLIHPRTNNGSTDFPITFLVMVKLTLSFRSKNEKQKKFQEQDLSYDSNYFSRVITLLTLKI